MKLYTNRGCMNTATVLEKVSGTISEVPENVSDTFSGRVFGKCHLLYSTYNLHWINYDEY